MHKPKYGPGRLECTAPDVPRAKGKFMFRAQQPGESDAEYEALEDKAEERFNRLEARKGGLANARKAGPRTTSDLDDHVGPEIPGSDEPSR